MQASSVKEPFDSPDWVFKLKPDDYRAIAVIDPAGKKRGITEFCSEEIKKGASFQ
jgi:hypothetical protein